MNRVIARSKQFILGKCQCGCNQDIPIARRKSTWILRRFINHHVSKLINKGSSNGQWKGSNVGYGKLHTWVRLHLPEPSLCQYCHKVKPYDLANVTGIYDRDFTNWLYLCRKCHMLSDGRFGNLRQYGAMLL